MSGRKRLHEDDSLPDHLAPLADSAAKKHRSSGIKVDPGNPSLVKPVEQQKKRHNPPVAPAPKRYGGRYLTGFNGKSFPKPRIRKRKKR